MVAQDGVESGHHRRRSFSSTHDPDPLESNQIVGSPANIQVISLKLDMPSHRRARINRIQRRLMDSPDSVPIG
jgi:hypothetical protein